eukprot:TRINITY_DN948_c0_g1_i2.p1 TRINITY_DN948_c0_g1~~TRINITY_DN948_c0_g1_i2.p1  ORF type:complete len:122 (+),score=40.36 TRINITY_DN948_c0_g1_i2:584-949(+)
MNRKKREERESSKEEQRERETEVGANPIAPNSKYRKTKTKKEERKKGRKKRTERTQKSTKKKTENSNKKEETLYAGTKKKKGISKIKFWALDGYLFKPGKIPSFGEYSFYRQNNKAQSKIN